MISIVPSTVGGQGGQTLAIALVVAVIGPMFLSWLTHRNAMRMKQQEWDRQDKVAADLRAYQETVTKGLDDVAKVQKETKDSTDSQLKQIHTLVNSNLTAAMRGELTAVQSNLLALRKLESLNPSSTPEELGAIKSLETRERELSDTLAERMEQQRLIDKMTEEGMATIQVTGPMTSMPELPKS